MYELVVIGNPSFDRFSSLQNNGQRLLSGPATHSVVTAARLGLENLAIVGAVGPDFELQFKSLLHDYGVPEYLVLDSERTGGLELEENGRGEFTLHRCISTARRIGIRDVPDEFLSSKVILLAPMLQEIDEEFIQWICNSSDAQIYLDPQIVTSKENGAIVPVKDFETFEKTQCFLDVVQMNQQDAALFTGEADPYVAAELLVDIVSEQCILTLGSSGCLAYDGYEFSSVSAYSVTPVDTYCAGAVHLAGILSSAMNGKSLSESIVMATALASMKVENQGLEYVIDLSELKSRTSQIEGTMKHR